MKKHAFLIMAHNEFTMLRKLLSELDDERNDIYLHIDKKTKYVDYKEISSWVNRSNLIFVPRKKVYWGTYSLVDCELRLLKIAHAEKYAYYHLISGTDLPLKSQDEMHEVFDLQDGEFVEYHANGEKGDDFEYKIKYWYPVLKYVGKGGFPENGMKNRFLRKLNDFQAGFVKWQEKHGVNRIKKYRDITFYKGAEWISITDDFAAYILSMKKKIKKMFRLTNGSDEIFVQTIGLNSHFKDRIRNLNYRQIDWERGNPYEFKCSDYEELINCEAFFARKVSYNHEPYLVERVLQSIHHEDGILKEELPLISLIVPCYNVKEYLEECVSSLLKQTYPSVEIILIDDGSKDETVTMIDEYSKKYSNVRGIHKENGGLSSARNRGIEEAKGEYLAFLDSDDHVDPSFVEKLYKAIKKYHTGIAVCGYEMFENEQGTVSFDEEKAISGYEVLKILGDIYHKENVLFTIACNKLCRSDIFKDVRFAEGRIHEDVFAAHRILGAVDSIAVIPEALYHYRIREGSITSPEKKQNVRHLDLADGLLDRLAYTKNMFYAELTRQMITANLHGLFELIIGFSDETVKKYHLISVFRKRALKLFFANFFGMNNKQRKEFFKLGIFTKKMRKFLIENRQREILEKQR